MGADRGERLRFELRVAAAAPGLPPAEARTARFFAANPEAVVLGSAAQIAAAAGASDATVVRTARALGYVGLQDMREDILAGLTGAASPARLLSCSLDAAGDTPEGALAHVLARHEEALAALRRPETAAAFARALALISGAGLRHVFGIGPSGAIADYIALQFNRIGLRSRSVTTPGVALADGLAWIGSGDVLVMLAYAPLYREVTVLLERTAELGVPVVLVSDSLGPLIEGRVAEVLAVPRGRSGHLALHGATLVMVEALILGLAARDRAGALDSLDLLSRQRGRLDRDWIKRGTRRSAARVSAATPNSDEGRQG